MVRKCFTIVVVGLLCCPQPLRAITDTDIEALGQPASSEELETFIAGSPKKSKKETCLKGCMQGACCMTSICSVVVVVLLYLASNRTATTHASPGIAAGSGNMTVPAVDPCYTMCAALPSPQTSFYIPSVLKSGDTYMFLKQCTPSDFKLTPSRDRVLTRRKYQGLEVCDLPGPPITEILSTLTLSTTQQDDDTVPFLTGVPATSQ